MSLRVLLAGAVAALATALFSAASAQGATPRYDIKAGWGDTNLGALDAQGHPHEGQLFISARNIGDASSESAVTVTDELPSGITITAIEWENRRGGGEDLSSLCSGLSTETLVCTIPGSKVPVLLPAPSFGEETPSAITDGYLPAIYVSVAVSPSASGTGTNTATISGGGAPTATDVDQVPLGGAPSAFGLVPESFEADAFDAAYPFGSVSRQAGNHPFEQRVNFDITEETGKDVGGDGHRYTLPTGLIKDVEVTLPRGAIGNPEATPKCDPTLFASAGATRNSTACPADTQVGYLNAFFADGTGDHGQGVFNDLALTRVAVYNLVPPKGVLADFGFDAGSFVLGHIYPTLDPAHEYAIKTVTPDVSSALSIRGSQVTFWGVPGDPAHDRFRYYPQQQENGDVLGAPFGGAAIRPLLTDPVDCGFENGGARIRLDSYNHPGEFTPLQEYGNPFNVTGCDDPRFGFEPQIALQPTDAHAGAPTGLDVHLEVPQQNDEAKEASELYAENGDVKGIGTPPIKRAVVTFPEGMTLNPSAAQGLGTCTSAEIGLGTDSPVTCPDNSQYGRLILHSPALPQNKPVEGFIYVAKQNDNPFHNLISLYLVIQDAELGLLVKVPGEVSLDPNTGQITTIFDGLPQLPVSDMQMTFKSGARAGLVEPSTCGEKAIDAEFFSWQDPSTPHVVTSSYDITQNPDGSPCVNSLGERPFKPSFAGGTTDNTADRYSPFVVRLTRTDQEQEFSQLGATLPRGLAAKFAGVGECSDAAIEQAEGRKEPGEGVLEQVAPSCPASSRIGTSKVGTGVGVPLTWVPGNVYLAGPYKGAPLSLVVISPAVVGPFDLGVVVVRTALNVNAETAQGEATSDPFPQIFHGISVRIRDVRLDLDRSGFTLNPTSCAEKQVEARVTGTGGNVQSTADDSVANVFDRFQAAHCTRLGFKPKLAFRLFGGTHRGAFPKLRAVVTFPKKGAYANVASAKVALPKSELIENAHFKTICTRVQFAASECPAGSVYGHAVAKTPLFETPLKGPVYLRSTTEPDKYVLPDVVAALRGPPSMPVEVDLVGHVDSIHGGIRNTFKVVPDAPVERFTLTLLGGRKGLFVNSESPCAKTPRANARFVAQNGRHLTLHPALVASCKASKRHRRGH